MAKNLFFMSHDHKETGGGEDSVSKHNIFEVGRAFARPEANWTESYTGQNDRRPSDASPQASAYRICRLEPTQQLNRQGPYSGAGDIVVLCAYLGQLIRMRDALAGKVVTVIDERDQQMLAAHEEEREDTPRVSGAEQVAVSSKVGILTTCSTLIQRRSRTC
jgi:hypothetical protein